MSSVDEPSNLATGRTGQEGDNDRQRHAAKSRQANEGAFRTFQDRNQDFGTAYAHHARMEVQMRMPVFASLLILLAPIHTLAQQPTVRAHDSLRASIAREATRAALAATQDPTRPGAWDAVLALKLDAPIKLVSRDGRKIVGSFRSANANGIVVDKSWGGREMLRRDEVQEIRMRPRRSTAGSAGIGFLLGFGLGATVGGIAGCHGPCSGDERAEAMTLSGAFGGSVGLWTGLIRGAVTNLRAGTLIYRVPQSTITP